MNNDTLIKYSKAIIFLSIVVLGLLVYIAIEKNYEPAEDKPQIIDEVTDSTSIKMDDKSNYRSAANFIGSDFNPDNGRMLYRELCSPCHSVDHEEKRIGPSLFGVVKRMPDIVYLTKYLSNTDSLVQSGDPYANKLREEYKSIRWNHTDSLLTQSSMNDLAGFLAMIR